MDELHDHEQEQRLSSTFGCTGCGADLQFKAGTSHLECPHCGTQNEIPVLNDAVEEIDFHAFLETQMAEAPTISTHQVACGSCGASSSVESNIQSAFCPYCDTALVVADAEDVDMLRPGSLLPFHINSDQARTNFRAWIRKGLFVPSKLKAGGVMADHFKGVYLPYWTFDAQTESDYTGQRGEHYYETESYTTIEDGKSVSKTRQVRKTRWYRASGHISHFFNDVLVPASTSLPDHLLSEATDWDLDQLNNFDERFLSGYITERYQVALETGFERARDTMKSEIRYLVRRDIGGDEQRIFSLQIQHSNITFKLILLPVYVSSYRWKGKLYQFLVNARTGRVIGKKPVSALKVAIAIILALIVIGAIAFLAMEYN